MDIANLIHQPQRILLPGDADIVMVNGVTYKRIATYRPMEKEETQSTEFEIIDNNLIEGDL